MLALKARIGKKSFVEVTRGGIGKREERLAGLGGDARVLKYVVSIEKYKL